MADAWMKQIQERCELRDRISMVLDDLYPDMAVYVHDQVEIQAPRGKWAEIESRLAAENITGVRMTEYQNESTAWINHYIRLQKWESEHPTYVKWFGSRGFQTQELRGCRYGPCTMSENTCCGCIWFCCAPHKRYVMQGCDCCCGSILGWILGAP